MRFLYLPHLFLLLCLLSLCPLRSSASHFRGVEMTYEDLGSGQYKIIVKAYWRRGWAGLFGIGFLNITGNPTVISPFSPQLPALQTPLLADSISRVSTQEMIVSWPAPGIYEVSFSEFARIHGGNNFTDMNFYGMTIAVNAGGNTSCPSGSSPRFDDIPIWNFASTQPINYRIPTFDAEGNEVRMSLINPFDLNSPYTQMFASGFSLEPDGTILWPNPLPGQWTLAVKLEEYCNGQPTGAYVARDFILRVVSPGDNAVPVCNGLAPISVDEGQLAAFLFSANDPNGDGISLEARGLPLSLGASFTQTQVFSPAQAFFNWTPPGGSAGNYLIQITATDRNRLLPLACRSEVLIRVNPPGPALETQCLLNEFAQSGFAFWLDSIPGATSPYYIFEGTGGILQGFADSTALVTGIIVNKDSSHWRWQVTMKLKKRRAWADWSALGRSYKASPGSQATALLNHPDWFFYEMDDDHSALYGLDHFDGDTIYLHHMPASYYFGFQLGLGANDKNDAPGFSGWFTYDGSYQGHGDINTIAACRGISPGGIALRLMLEGAADPLSGNMRSWLSQQNQFPLTQPYSAAPFDYQGNEQLSTNPAHNIVDWVLVQLRDPLNPAAVVYERAALLRDDLRLVELDGQSLVNIQPPAPGAYYISVLHRNHLGIMSAVPVVPDKGGFLQYDFTRSMSQYYQHAALSSPPAKAAGPFGRCAMIAGDADCNGAVNALDVFEIVRRLNRIGYLGFDINLSTGTTYRDADITRDNYFMKTHVPGLR